MPLRPLHNVVLIKPDGILKHDGKIALPDENSIEKRSPLATVVKTGKRCIEGLKTGDRILYEWSEKYPMFIQENGELLRLIYEHKIIGKIIL